MDQVEKKASSSDCFLLVQNIPKSYHSSDLRRFFSTFVESGKFSCFHFRHRPEVKKETNDITGEDGKAAKKTGPRTRCCIVKIKKEFSQLFVDSYRGKHWTNEKHEELHSKCFMTVVKMSENDPSLDKAESPERKLSVSDVEQMPELHPPAMMPQGNVGTPTEFFLQAIQECRLPANVIANLKLEFPMARRKRKYGSVPFDYGPMNEHSAFKHKPAFLHRSADAFKKPPSLDNPKAESGSDDDDDTCEEWERHEALHDDVAARRIDPSDISGQPGTKERLFEEEMEVTWDKGSSGLVFYTDAQVWKEQEGDFDEQTTDDWDVDMSVYYDKEAGDKDARDGLNKRAADFLRAGNHSKSAFWEKKPRVEKVKNTVTTSSSSSMSRNNGKTKIGKFEMHTKGFGRKLMESQGWKDGQGLGQTYVGMSEALESDGQSDKTGLGYYGPKLDANSKKPIRSYSERETFKTRKRNSIRDVIISTVYDKPEDVDPGETLRRRNPQNYLSHRDK